MGKPGPSPVYARRIRVFVTAEQLEQINREMTLAGTNVSEVVRAALTAYFDKPAKRRRRAS